MATTSPYHIANLLDKMTSSDKDFRFMATNDLMTELQRDSIKLDDDSERKVVQMLLKLLEDRNGEVQNLAVKCLGPLVCKVKEYQVEGIVDTLCANMAADKEQLRDISSIGLKTVISELPPASTGLSSSICKRITGRLTETISKIEDQSVQLEALDILADLLSRFGGLLVTFHQSVLKSLLPLLLSPRMAVRKRTIIAIGHLVMSANQSIFVELITHVLGELEGQRDTVNARTFIQCIAAICRHAGRRIGDYLEKIVPIVVQFSMIESDDELRECCIQAFESFVCRCPKEVTQYVEQITKLCLDFLCYDPNYNYGSDDDDDRDGMDVNEGDEDDDEDDDDVYSDDDDMSWKVRRASAKCLGSILGSRPDLLREFYASVSPKLIARFKEREENVKSDIFQAYVALLRQTRPVALLATERSKQERQRDVRVLNRSTSMIECLSSQVASMIKVIHKQLLEKSIKTRQGCFHLLTELVTVLPGALSGYMSKIIPGVQHSLSDKASTSNIKIDTLSFLGCILTQHEPEVFYDHIHLIVPAIVAAVGDQFYKITSEALLVTQHLVKVMRPVDRESSFDFQPYLKDLYQCVFLRLRAADIDQEVKERSIHCMGQILCNMGDVLTSELGNCLPIFLDRLRNEITRLTAVKAVTSIAGSPLKINLQIILPEATPLLATFLRKNHRALKLSTLTCLDTLVKNYGKLMAAEHLDAILFELSPLISESDLHISQLALMLLTSITRVDNTRLGQVQEKILPATVELTRSPLLQGSALTAMLAFLTEAVKSDKLGLSYRTLLQILTKPIYEHDASLPSLAVHKQAFHSIAKCVTVLTIVCKHEADAVVSKFISDIMDSKSSDSVRLFALLALGEIGSYIDLSKEKKVKAVIVESFSSDSEEVKSAAAYALGHVCIGNLNEYLSFILQEIQENPKRQYLLLQSLKEVISCQSANSESVKALSPFLPPIWNLLFAHCESKEQGTRNVVAECLGKLTLIDPTELLPKLQEKLTSKSAYVRSTVVTAFKFTITDQPQPIDDMLKQCVTHFLSLITDEDLNVRRVSLVTFNSAAHNKPAFIRDLLGDILPHLYNETKVRKELIREMEMGPFKHTVDDGLDIRKAAFECMYTLLDSCLDRIDIFEFLVHVEDGLKDHYDIKMLTYLMLIRLSTLCPNALLQHLDRIIEPLRTTVQAKVKAYSVKQEFEKQDELKRSALRAVAALQQIPDADVNPLLSDFLSQINASQELSALFESVQRDPSAASNTESMDTSQ
ncbi:cullin-associated NEDD8-dissociated protein 1-like [Rhopilema esculentum]|uniref:cullin-associated NEDD8-dissociated protein 1-like n=1 Tax=Rhopilema esculentum TaxID=499914 RepID=UPI0031E1974C|eukprot:gene8059-13974_t